MAEIGDRIIRYLAARDRERDDRVNRALGSLTERERALVREASVMGYVLGRQGAGAEGAFPKDSDIVWSVIDACHAVGDPYPTINALTDDGDRRG